MRSSIVAILSPDHLLEQADALLAPPSAGRPRQVDLRRSISSAYYAAFHAVITGAADEFVGVTARSTREHALVMRSIDHRTIKLVCTELTKTSPPRSYLPYVPAMGFGTAVSSFCAAFPDLQEERHAADYDSLRMYVTADAYGILSTARSAINLFRAAPWPDRKAFLFLLLFPPRR